MAVSLRAPVAYPILYPPSTKSVRIPKNFSLTCRAFRPRPFNDYNIEEEGKKSFNANKHLIMETITSPELRASPAEVETSQYYRDDEYVDPNTYPPDMASFVLDRRCVYIGLPLVPAVAGLILEQLLYLQITRVHEPVQIAINCCGTISSDGEVIGFDSDGFAIYDQIMLMKRNCKVTTINLVEATGQACLFLAAGSKKKRFSWPHATATLHLPRTPPSNLMHTSDVLVRTRKALLDREYYLRAIVRHTKQPRETVSNLTRKQFAMDPVQAQEFGIIDQVRWLGKKRLKEALEAKAKARKNDPIFKALREKYAERSASSESSD